MKQSLACWLACLLLVQHGTATSPAPPAQQQQPFNNYIGLLAASNMPVVSAFHGITSHKPTLDRLLVKNGLVYTGANGRLRRVVSKLLHGEPVSIGVIGGSVSFGHGVQRGSQDWFSLFTQFLGNAFPRAKISERNGCVPGTQTEYFSACLERFVDADVDLVFLEFATNDGYLDTSVNNGYVHAFERLVRKLLHFPRSPAVVLINSLHSDAKKNNLPFYHSIEDHFGVVAQYYGLPWLSLRDAVWQGLVNDWEGFRVADLFVAGEQHERNLNERGHRYMADLAVGLVQTTYLQLMLQPLTAADVAASDALHTPMFAQNYESRAGACSTGIDFRAAAAANRTDWYFVNEGTVQQPRWGFVSHIPGALLVLQLDTRANGAHPIPQLTLQQKVQLLQHHGMFAAAAQLQNAAPALAAAAATAALAAASSPAAAAAAGDGMQAAMQAAEEQARAVAQMMSAGVLQPFSQGERLVGGGGSSGLVSLPPDAKQALGASKTATGVEVIMNTPASGSGRRMLSAAAAAAVAATGQQQQLKAHAAAGAAEDEEVWRAAAAVAPHVSLSRLLARLAAAVLAWRQHPGGTSSGSGDERRAPWRQLFSSSSGSSGGGSSRSLQAALPANAVPPPADAIYLQPSKPGSSQKNKGNSGSSSSSSSLVEARDMLVWVAVHKSPSRMMGSARLFCMSGCVCSDVVVDAWLNHTSSSGSGSGSRRGKTVMHKLATTQHAECRIGVEVLAASSTRHHKIKVVGVVISRAVEYSGDTDHQRAELMAAIEQQQQQHQGQPVGAVGAEGVVALGVG